MKNLTPRQLAFFTALILTVPVAVGAYFLHPTWWIMILLALTFLVVAYLLNLYMLETFIYRKIKLIYKFIYRTKASRRQEVFNKYLLPPESIDEVQADVEEWAKSQQGEIETLRANESYRREFLQNLAHELKTPAFAIQGYLHTIMDSDGEDPEMSERFLRKASRNVDRLVSLLNDLDVISNLETGRQPLQEESFPIIDLIKEVFEQSQINALQKNIKLQFKKGAQHNVNVFADKLRIAQVLQNLVNNAIKYTNDEGLIEASVYGIDGERVLVEISDNGIGIPEEQITRVFERFYRTDLARNRNVGGSGLGLSICKHIIEAHGQTIHGRSKPGVGSTFGFTLSTLKPRIK